jgi:hypothetical protein
MFGNNTNESKREIFPHLDVGHVLLQERLHLLAPVGQPLGAVKLLLQILDLLLLESVL